MIKAIFFDVDGTLRDFKTGKVSPGTKHALQKARDKGILLFVATGRHVLEMEESNLLEDLVFDGYITLNGAYCYNEEQTIQECPIAPEQVHHLMRLAEEEPFPCLVMERDAMYINLVNDSVEEVQASITTPVPDIRKFETELIRPVYQMIPYVDEHCVEHLKKLLPECEFTKWHAGHAYDVTTAGMCKEKGIAAILEYYGLTSAECAAIGDGYNDITMIQFAGIGIAMGNGNDEIKAAADHITASVSEEGVAAAIDWLINNYNSFS